MKTILLLIAFSISTDLCFGQSDTIFYDQDGAISKRNIAKYYRLSIKDGTHFIAKDYFINNVLQMVAVYTSLDPDVKDGKCVEYNEKGKKLNSGYFNNNKPVGVWTLYGENGQDSTFIEYQNDGSYIYLNEGHFVNIRGKKQFVIIEGKGKPTVVFVNGKGRTSSDFRGVYKKIEKNNQIFAYDRSGLGQSEFLNNQRRIDTMAFELNELLVKEKLAPPFILVGHSLGAFVIRCFTHLYPKKVAGLVFVDGGYEQEFADGLKIRTEADQVKWRDYFKTFVDVPTRSQGHNAESKYIFDFDSTNNSTHSKILKNIKLPKDIPITVFLANIEDESIPYSAEMKKIRFAYYENWKKDAPQLNIIIANKSDHDIQFFEPDLLIDGINEQINKIKLKQTTANSK